MQEVTGFDNARTRMATLFEVPPALPAGILDDYARIASFLSDRRQFTKALTSVSERLWSIYKSFDGKTRNKFTTAIARFSSQYGFMLDASNHALTNTVVLVGAIDGAQYLEWVKSGVFFKDDMDLKHGEHSHTLQWLAIAVARKEIGLAMRDDPSFLYKNIYEIKSRSSQKIIVPGFKLKQKSKEQAERNGVSLWSWLLDCFPLSTASNGAMPGGESLFTESFRCPQVLMQHLIDETGEDHFLGTYLRYRYRRRRWLSDKTAKYGDISGGATSKNYMKEKMKQQPDWKGIAGEDGQVGAYVKTAKSATEDGEDKRSYVDVVFHGQPGRLRDPSKDWV